VTAIKREPLKIGFVGCGSHATGAWYPNFAKISHLAKLVACCDLDRKLAKQNQKLFGADRFYTDMDKMLAEELLDAVMIVGQPPMHVACGRKSLQAGLPTMMEKPMSATLEEARELVELAERQGIVTQIGHNMRHGYMMRKARQLIDKKEFGQLLYVECLHHVLGPAWNALPTAGWTTADSPEGWHYLLIQAVHPIDLMRHIGGEIKTAHATLSKRGKEDRFAMLVAVTFDSGACGAITMTGASANWSSRLEVVGDGPATLRLTNMSHLL